MPSWPREGEILPLLCLVRFCLRLSYLQYCSQKLKIKIGVFSISIGKGNTNMVPLIHFCMLYKTETLRERSLQPTAGAAIRSPLPALNVINLSDMDTR